MTWVRMDDAFYDHPKVVPISDAAFRLWVCSMGYCGRHLTDGFIPVAKVATFCQVRRIKPVIEELVSARLWEPVEGGFTVHDFLAYNPSKEQVTKEREAGAKRQQGLRGRRNADSNGVTNGATNGMTNGATNRTPSRPVLITSKEGAEAPPKEKTKGVNLAPLYAAFKAAGLERPVITKQEHSVAGDLLQQVGPDALVGIWMDIGKCVWPPDDKTHWMLNNRSFGTIAPRINNWIDFKNGRHVKVTAGKECKDWEDR